MHFVHSQNNIDNKMKKFERYISQYSEEELNKNLEEIVREYNQIPENKNKFVKPILIGNYTLIGGGTFEEYKEDYQKRINTDLSNKEDVKKHFQKSVISKILKVDSYKTIYENLKSGGSDQDVPEYFFAENYWKRYLYYTKKHTIEELIKFENFLIKSKTITESPQIEFKDFFDPKVSDSAIKAIKEEYKDVKGKRLAILIYVLSKENMIRIISGDKAGNSRNDFIKSLNPEIKKTQGVNHYLSDFGNLDLKFISENDPDFISISEKVKTIIKESV